MTIQTTETRDKGTRVVTLPFKPNPAQDEFIHSGNPKTAIVASVAAGKTVALCMRAWMLSYKYPDNKGMLARYTWDEIRNTIIPTWKKVVPRELMINPECLDRQALGTQTLWVHSQDPERPSAVVFRNLEDFHTFESEEFGHIGLSQANDPKITRRMWDTLNERLRWPSPYHFCYLEANWGGNASKGGWIWDEFEDKKQGHLVTADTMVNWDNLPDDYKARLANLPKYRQLHSVYGCYDEDTEILTRRGWKRHAELVVGEDVLTLDPQTGISEYQPIEQVWRYDWDSPMCSFKNRSIDLLVTPDHNMLLTRTAWTKRSPDRFFRKASDLLHNESSHFAIPRQSAWIGEERETFVLPAYENEWRNGRSKVSGDLVETISAMRSSGMLYREIAVQTGISTASAQRAATRGLPHTRKVERPDLAIKMDTWLAFLGLYLSEGSVSKYRAKIAQSWHDPRIESILEALPWPFHRTKSGWTATSRQLCTYLSQFGKAHSKFIPRDLMGLSGRQLGILLDYLMLGDGSVRRDGRRCYYTTSPRLADDVQELFQKVGSSALVRVRDIVGQPTGIFDRSGKPTGFARYPAYRVTETRNSQVQARRFKRTLINYIGTVWCVTVPNHTVYVRRMGSPIWCGQSWDPLIEVNGIVCYPEFKFGFHTPEDGSVGDVRKLFTRDRPVIRGIDVPGPGAATWVQMDEKGRLLIGHELALDHAIGTAEFADIVQSDSAQFFPGCRYVDYIDPSANRVEQTSEKSNADILREKGFRPIGAGIQIEKRLQVVKDWLTMAVQGEAGLLVDPGCHRLIGGFQGGYHFEKIGSAEGRYAPFPSKNSYSHIHDALQYACNGVARLQYASRRDDEAPPMPTAWLGSLRRDFRRPQPQPQSDAVSSRSRRDVRIRFPRIDD